MPIKPVNGLIGFANVVYDDKFFLGSIGIHKRLDGTGFRLTYPTKKTGEKNINIYHPIVREVGWEIEAAIIQEANKIWRI